MPPAWLATTAAASQVPKTAPTSAVHADRMRLFFRGIQYWDAVKIVLKFSQVNLPASVVNAPWITTYSGRPRKMSMYAVNGAISEPSAAARR